MELVKKLNTRNYLGKLEGLFYCPICNNNVVKDLSNGKKNKSCGCKIKHHKNLIKELYYKWINFKTRCYNKNNVKYKNYGARNIKVCDSWLNDYDEFQRFAINNGWKKGLQIDRIDVNGDYTPKNIRFVEAKINSRNKTNNTFNNVLVNKIKKLKENVPTLTSIDLAKIYGVNDRSIRYILRGEQWQR